MHYESSFLRKNGNRWRGVLKYKDGNSWRVVSKTLDARGKRDARRELEAWRDEMEAEAQRAADAEARGYEPGETVSAYVAAYIEGRSLHVERSTAAEYRRVLRKLIDPGIGGVELDALEPDAVQAWVNGLAEEFAPVTVRKALVLLRSAMRQAVERDRLAKDPTRTVKPPRIATPKPNALDAGGRAKVARFLAIDPSTAVNIGIALALYLGMREGEVCGLRWANVDLDRRVLHVVETIGHEGSRWYVKEPKTGGSRRELCIPDVLADAMAVRRAEMDRERAMTGIELDRLYVTGGADGRFMQPHYLSAKWRRIADSLELSGTQGRRPTFHDLRHTCATTAIAAGVDVKTVSSMLGHANAAMTLNVYASADPDAKRRGAEAVAAAMEGED